MPEQLRSARKPGPRRRVVSHRVVPVVPEPLEPRALLSVSLDAAGFTVVAREDGDRAVYVSASTGDDGNDGSSPDRAVRSLDAGVDKLRDGRGDQLLLMRGDTWHGALPAWKKSGASADRPMVIGAYGTGDRPTISTRGGSAFVSGVSSGRRVDHLAVLGVKFTAGARDPDSPEFDASLLNRTGIGVQFFAGGSDVLIEDCEVSYFTTNVALQDGMGDLSDVRLRRNLILNAYADPSVHAEGLFADGVRGLLLEGNVLDHNGWSERVPGAKATMFNHDAYLTVRTTGVVVKGNVFANAASHGLQARGGGDVLDNLFVTNPLHMSYGLVRGDSPPAKGGVTGIVNGNVFLGTRDIDGQDRGFGIEIANTAAGGTPTIVSNNVFSNEGDNGVPWERGAFAALSLAVGSGAGDAELAAGLRDLRVEGNIVRRWAKGVTMQGGMSPGGGGTNGYSNLVVRRNEFSNLEVGPAIDHPAAYDGAYERWTGNRFDDEADGGSAKVRVAGRSLSVSAWADDYAAGDRDGTPAYADATRSLKTYARSAGGSAAGDFFTWARAGDPRGSAAAAIAYVRAGFENPDPAAARRNWQPPTPPEATAELPAVVRTDESTIAVTVTYRDDKGVDTATIDANDVYLVGRSDRRLPATAVTTTTADGGRTVVATYVVASPAAVWRTKDRGTYKVAVAEGEVKDFDGFAVEAGGVVSATVDVEQVPPPVGVRKVKFYRGKRDLPDRLAVAFTQDLSAVPAAGDLHLVAADGTAVDLTGAVVEYDPERRLATWTFPTLALPGLAVGQLPESSYTLTLSAATVRSTDAKPLDGNGDGLGGDDYLMAKPLKVRR
ncbi:MAG TPA: hypothetical protein VF796_01190 [Humisphaera sp.]